MDKIVFVLFLLKFINSTSEHEHLYPNVIIEKCISEESIDSNFSVFIDQEQEITLIHKKYDGGGNTGIDDLQYEKDKVEKLDDQESCQEILSSYTDTAIDIKTDETNKKKVCGNKTTQENTNNETNLQSIEVKKKVIWDCLSIKSFLGKNYVACIPIIAIVLVLIVFFSINIFFFDC